MDSERFDPANLDAMFAEVRRVLRHLYDPTTLRLSPLARLIAPDEGGTGANRAMLLRQMLMEAVETLSPGGNVPLRSGEWRPYHVVRGRYVEQQSMDTLSVDMGLSERQLRRELREGTMAIAEVIQSRLRPDEERAVIAEDERMAEAVRDLGEAIESVNVCAELRATERLVTPLAQEHGVALREGAVPESAIVQANRVLLRQVLLALYTWPIEQLGASLVDIRVARLGDKVRVEWLCAMVGEPDIAVEQAVPAELLAALGGDLSASHREGACCLALDLASTPTARILLVDDNSSLHNLVKRYLVGMPYVVISAYDAESALDMARNLRPDLVLADIMMPDRDGWELLRMLKGDPAMETIPVVICSVLEQRALAESLQAAGYLMKPVTQSALLNLLDKLDLGGLAG